MYGSWGTIFVWMPSRDILVPKVQEYFHRLCIISVKSIYRWCIFHPKETMDVTASTMLPLISPPVVFNLELGLYDLFKENLPSFLKIVGSYSRIIIEIIHPCMI